jgi:peptide/nickel transport system substrate-binding protein
MSSSNQLNPAAPVDLIVAPTYGAWIEPGALEAAAADDQYFEQGVDAGTGPHAASYTPDEEVVLGRTRTTGAAGATTVDTVLMQIVPEATQQQRCSG